jgi:tRNA-2-methylthio-N6-dimethylallyladenosine synthase
MIKSQQNKNFYIKSFGCQYNEWDGSRLAFILTSSGFVESTQNNAEIVFLLNCSVRKTGVDRAMSFTKNFIKAGKKVFVSGCILDRDKKIFKEKGATIWNMEDINELMGYLGIEKDENILKYILSSSQKSTNLIPIMKGCNNFCSYCAVPYTRGREISRPIEKILEDIEKVIDAGHKEIWLLGQNVNSYEFGFAKLLKVVNEIEGDFSIRFTSNHPKDMSDEIIKAVANLQKVAKEIHLPIQSGSNKVLRGMNRPYTREKYLGVIEKIVKTVPNVKITTDIIVGFPSETEEDFQETVSLLKSINFSQAYINKYSPREGTAAFKLGDPVPWKEKERRWRILNEIVNLK